ncbi:MAG: biotin--[acetyl-CoA-carboxylase] ligase [Thermodesulfobacteriota bacterium]
MDCGDWLSPRSLLRSLQRDEFDDRKSDFSPEIIHEILSFGAVVGSSIDCHCCLDRAMDEARRLISDNDRKNCSTESGRVILAERMEQARGRFARSWHAPIGGLWGCLILADTLLPEASRLLPLALGVAGCEAVAKLGGGPVTVRWVNDLLLGSSKLGGFLAEQYFSPVHGESFHLLGFGINVNNHQFPSGLAEQPTSLALATGRKIDLAPFSLLFLRKLAWNYGLICFEEKQMLAGEPFSGHDGAHALLSRWRELSDTIGRRVAYGYDIQKNLQYRATVTGLSADGGLQLLLDDGSTIVEHSGELRYLD